MELNLYNKEGQLKATVSPADSSTLTEGLMTDYILSLSFGLFDCVPLDVNDYVDFLGKRYWMLEAYIPNQKSTIEWNYSVKFYGIESVIRRALCLKTVDNELNPLFSLTAPAIEHVRLVVQNINRVMGTTDWKVGEVEATANLTIDYNGTYCDAALASIATAADTEYWIDGLTVNLCRCEYGELIELGYGNGLREITLDTNENAKFFTRLFPLGSTRNIDVSKYGSTRLHLPGDVKYVEQNTHYGVIEHYEEATFADIYPRRIGKVGVVRKETKKGEDGKDFDIYYFTDPDIDFDPNKYEIGGLVKSIVFETGDLAGRDFEVNYNAEAHELEVITQWPYGDEIQLPGALVMKPTDEYILYNLTMPTEYYPRAEQEFATAVTTYMEKNKRDKSVYKAPTDYIDLSERGIDLTVGQRVRLLSNKYFPSAGYRDSRITKITRKVNETLQADIEISDLADIGGKATLTQGISEAKHYAQTALAGLPDMIKSWENTPASDSNLYTAKKVDKEIQTKALRKDQPDSTDHLLKLLGGLISDDIKSQYFTEGALGSGFVLRRNPTTGKSYLEVDEAYIRLKAYFDTLEIRHLSHVGGQFILSPASMECVKVAHPGNGGYEELADIEGSELTDSQGSILKAQADSSIPDGVFRCYFNITDGEKTIVNEFAVDDLAQCREFNIKTGVHENVSNQYYWRKVVALGDNYIDLSVSDCDTGSTIPKAGDTIVTVGNRTDGTRQHVIILSTVGDDAPSIKQYAGIDDYSMLGKEVTVLSPKGNKITGQFVIQEGSSGGGNLGDIVPPELDEIKKDVQEAIDAAEKVQEEVNDAQRSVNDLNDYVDGAFSDGIISKAEAAAIEKYINIVRSAKADTEATYSKLYANEYLSGTPKSDLLNAKITFFGAVDSLLASINTAIADAQTTVSEKQDVDAKYATFNEAYAGMSIAIESANKAILDKLKEYSDAAQKSANEAVTSIGNIPKEVKDAIAVNLGYSDYAALQKAAELGKTLIKGGRINTELIEATAIVTAQLIADAIRANSLNINNKFIVEKDGTFKGVGGQMEDMLLSGAFRTPFKGGTFRWNSDGPIYVQTPGLQNNNNIIIPNEETYAFLACDLPCTMDYDGFNATILNEDYNDIRTYGHLSFSVKPGYAIYENGEKKDRITVSMREGVDIQGFSDGTAFRGWIVKNRFKSSTSESLIYGEIITKSSPANGGTVTGGGYKAAGTTGILKAVANTGYVFSRWNDGVLISSREVTWPEAGVIYTAYFAVAERMYTITLNASPANGGTVTGGGTDYEGTNRTIEALPGNGYVFSHWSDGSKKTFRSVTWDADKTYTAYFTSYTPSTGELLTNVAFKDTTAVALFEMDMVADFSLMAFNSILIWNSLNYVSGETRGITYNRGFLAGKMYAGKKYIFTIDVNSEANQNKKLGIYIGRPLIEPMVGNPDETFDSMGLGTTVSGTVFEKGYIRIAMEFTASRTATANDCIIFLSDATLYPIQIKNPSLKEIL